MKKSAFTPLILLFFTVACQIKTAAPVAPLPGEQATLTAVQRSLDTINPEGYLYSKTPKLAWIWALLPILLSSVFDFAAIVQFLASLAGSSFGEVPRNLPTYFS
jgi:hypothetical protein